MDKNFPWRGLAWVRRLSKKDAVPSRVAHIQKQKALLMSPGELQAWRLGQRKASLLKYKP